MSSAEGVSIDYSQGRANVLELASWYEINKANRNEATTRHHLIDELIHRCLAWDRNDIILEESFDGTFADYTFTTPRNIMIWEAKREGRYFEVPAGSGLQQRVSALLNAGKETRTAIEQVTQYCQDRGVPIACICNGHQLITFMASREDGKAWREGRAFVFASLSQMHESFFELWQILSKPGIFESRYRERLLGDVRINLPPKLSTLIDGYPGSKVRTDFQSELNILSDIVIEDISRHRDLEETFLSECYCESGALSQYSLMSKDILQARYRALTMSPDLTVDAVPMAKRGLSDSMIAESMSNVSSRCSSVWGLTRLALEHSCAESFMVKRNIMIRNARRL